MFALLCTAGLVAAACDYVYAPFLSRLDQPVVFTGADLPQAIGIDPAVGVGFRWDAAAGTWVQIPIQVDQRVVVGFGSPPQNNSTAGVTGTVYGSGGQDVTALQYADPSTFVGADSDPLFDADDELVFMARDAGPQAPATATAPAGTAGPGLAIALEDPDGGTPGYVYLFTGTAGADPSAGEDYVDYQFSLDSGDYKTTYKRADGPNPESSTVTTYAYTAGMADRWMTTDLTLASGTGVDILDGLKARFGFNTCGRSNATFANAHGAFAANIDGPVRAIRSYIGANSGPLTQETVVFYADRIEVTTNLRVHAIPSIMSFFDWSSAAIGMEYGSSELAAPVTIDGDPDTVSAAIPEWEYVSGPQGVLSMHNEVTTSISGLSLDTVWVDDSSPPFNACWGDDNAFIGAAVTDITGGLPNTDPRFSGFETLTARRTLSVWTDATHADDWSPTWAAESFQPLTTAVSVFN